MDWLNNGQSVKVPVGNYRIFFKELEGFQTPSPIVIGVIKNQTTNVNIEYVPVVNGPLGERGIFGGSYTNTVNMDFINISTTSNAQVFGSLSMNGYSAMCSDSVKGLHGGGGAAGSSLIQYITISTLGNGSLFGYLVAGRWGLAACSNMTRGVFAGGYSSNIIDYVTFATNSNAILFGYLKDNMYTREIAAMSNNEKGIITRTISNDSLLYITMSTIGNAVSFGLLSGARSRVTGLSNLIYGYVIGGLLAYATRIDVITMATLSNSSIFGSTILDRETRGGGCSNGTRGIVGGGIAATANSIEYFNMSTTGSTTNFGSLTVYRTESAACSGN